MAAPVYATDLTDINLAESITGWSALGGGGAGLSAEPDFRIQGLTCVAKQIKAETKGQHYNNGATAQGADDHVYVWLYAATPGTTDLLTNGGLRVTVGTSGTARKEYYVAGNDTYFRGGWICYPIRYSLTPDNAVGTAGATPSFFGGVMQGTASVKSVNFGVDVIRYGSNVQITDGVGQPATFVGLAQHADDLSRSWGLISEIGGGAQIQGKVLIGTGAAQCEFDESNVLILFPDNNPAAVNQHTLAGHKEIIIDNALSDVTWDGITFLSLDSTDKGVITVNTSFQTVIVGCVFQNIATSNLHSSVVAINSSWILSDTVTANQATFTNCTWTTSTGASSVIVDDLNDISGCTFSSDGSNHAVELTSVGTGSMNWDSTLTNYVAGTTGSPASTSSTGNEAIFVNVATGTLTINVASGATVPSIRTAGATVNVVAGQVTFTITVKDIDTNAVVPDARVYIVADAGGNLAQGTVLIDKVNTDVNGEASVTTSLTADQPFVGSVRRATASLGDGTLYKPASPAGTISSAADSSLTVQLIKDQ